MNLEKFPIEQTWVYKKGEVAALLRVLAARGITLPDAKREHVLSCTDVAQLEAWLDRAATASSAEDVFDTR